MVYGDILHVDDNVVDDDLTFPLNIELRYSDQTIIKKTTIKRSSPNWSPIQMLLFFIHLLVVVLLFTVVHADDQDGDYDGQCKHLVQVCRLNIPEKDNQSTIFIVAQQQQWERQI